MPRSNNPSPADIRIRATRGYPREHGEEAPYLALTARDKAELGRAAQIIDFRTAGSEAFSQGDDAAFIYLLAYGVVRIYHTLRNGERQILVFHWPGDLLGLADHGKYVNSAETIASSTVYRFPVRKLERFLLKNPNIQDAFLVKAVHDLRNAQRQLIVMGQFNVPRRLAVFLVDCSAHEHYFDQSKQILTLPMSRYDIADYLGTSAETVTRALARLEGEGVLHRITARDLKLELDQLKAFIDFD
jgi:CRP-like cAMP-binding protein